MVVPFLVKVRAPSPSLQRRCQGYPGTLGCLGFRVSRDLRVDIGTLWGKIRLYWGSVGIMESNMETVQSIGV